jgi:hypothetical protein
LSETYLMNDSKNTKNKSVYILSVYKIENIFL